MSIVSLFLGLDFRKTPGLESMSMSDSPFIEHNGKRYARCTAIISEPGKFDHIDPAVLKAKCAIGTEVHSFIEHEIRGEFFPVETAAAQYCASFQKWCKAIQPEFLQSETRYYDDERLITGQIDSVISIAGSFPTLVDFKTSAAEDKSGWPRQAHMYHYLLKQNGISIAPRFLFIKLDKRGALPQVYEYRFDWNTHSECMQMIED